MYLPRLTEHCNRFILFAIFYNAFYKATSEPTPPSGFQELLASNAYVDKTLFIKTILDETDKILITAPHGFGKSTILEMVKRFFEIKMDENGEPTKIETTSNYRLFRGNDLKICKHEDIFKSYFGRYPVVFLDYSPHSGITSYEDLLDAFRLILHNAYSEHKYLLKNDDMFTESELKLFNSCVAGARNNLTVAKIKKAFRFLPDILFRRFKSEVVILIDEFDAYEQNLIFQNNSDTDDVIALIQDVNGILLETNIYLERALMMGLFTVTGVGLSDDVSDIMDCSASRKHIFNNYFGMSDIELDELLTKLIQSNEERERVKSHIVDFYKGYTILERNVNVYNMKSVLGFIKNKNDVNDYWCNINCTLQGLLFIFSFQTIQDQIEYLLNNDNTMALEISDSFTRTDIRSLRNMSRFGSTNETLVHMFFHLLFELGYLTANDGAAFKKIKTELRIPNMEVKLQFASVLRKVYNIKYNVSEKDVDDLNRVINTISPESHDKPMFQQLTLALNVLFGHAIYQSKNENGFQSILLVSFMKFFPRTRSASHMRKPRSIMYIILENHLGVSFLVTVKTTVSETKVYRKKVAQQAHMVIVKSGFIERLGVESRKKVVFLGISCSYKRNISIAYSYRFKEGDNLKKSTLMISNRKVD